MEVMYDLKILEVDRETYLSLRTMINQHQALVMTEEGQTARDRQARENTRAMRRKQWEGMGCLVLETQERSTPGQNKPSYIKENTK